jgi:hypothetical protein
MNKIEEINTFIEEEDIDVAIISESHDRENKKVRSPYEFTNTPSHLKHTPKAKITTRW